MAFAIHLTSSDMARERLREMMERMLRDSQAETSGWTPAVDIYETPEAVVIAAELAGINPDSVHITVDGDLVRISGRREPTCPATGAHYHRMEIASGEFVRSRSFRIRAAFSAENVCQHMVQARGPRTAYLLVITLPKERAPRAQTIPVESI